MRRRHIGIVFQFFNLLEGMTVLENVALPAVIAGRKTQDGGKSCARSSGPPGHRRQGIDPCGMLSGGQRQKARHRAQPWPTSPPFFWQTNPLGHWTPRVDRMVIELLSRLHTGGQTILLVTHDSNVCVGRGCGS